MWIAELVTDVISLGSRLPPLPPTSYARAVPRRLLRLVVPAPDRSRVLARPNGLAGWTLPVVPVPGDDDDAGWTDELLAAAERVVGAPVRAVREVVPGAWEVEPLGRVPRTGTAWIAAHEAGRLGADAAVLVRWADDGG
jgi:hypothetical protein